MVQINRKAAFVAMTTAMLWVTGNAFPSNLQLIAKRASLNAADYAGLAKEILKAFGVAFPELKSAWDYNAYPDMCAIYTESTDGGNCKAYVECNDGKREYNDWNVCFVGGRQYFTDDRIGDFSITYTKRDGDEGEGLTNPVIQLAYVGDWREIPVSELAREKRRFQECEKGIAPICNQDDPWVCTFIEMGNKYINDDRTKRYMCGMPKVGKGFLDFNSQGPINELGYAPGWCGLHLTQYQKPNPAVDSYGLEVVIKDNNQDQIGETPGRQGPTLSLPSRLPWTLEIQTGGVDADAVRFQYADQSWDSNDVSRCSVGAYDSGSRQMDCGFSC